MARVSFLTEVKEIFFDHWPKLVIFFLILLLAFDNYRPQTWLTGWDNLHPEFDFGLNLKRTIFSAWQEYQGLGLLGGMGHGADLFRELFLALLSLLFPLSFLRYFYHFLALALGAFGACALGRGVLFKKLALPERNLVALAVAIFYLFNLATVQMFYVPYEASSTHFAFLPWLFLSAFNYIKTGRRWALFWLFSINLFAAAQGYVGTYFLVYLIALGVSLVGFFALDHQPLRRFVARVGGVFLLIFLVNSFWLLPNLCFVVSGRQTNYEAKINLMSTEENVLRNRKFGGLGDVALLRGFWFDNTQLSPTGERVYQLGVWRDYLNKPGVAWAGYGLFTLALLGLAVSFWRPQKAPLIFLPGFLLSLTMLASQVPPFSFLNQLFFRSRLFFQIFRFPFTKFSLLLAFCLAVFYGAFLAFLLERLKGLVFRGLVAILIILLPLIFLWPVFRGELFWDQIRLKMPEEYFQVFEFFKRQEPVARVANFPQASFWSWNFYQWGYSGSGFLWYGIAQPILDRAFDPWGRENENYYWEITQAIYAQDQVLFEQLLEKYQISWLLIDGNIQGFGSWRAMGLDNLNNIIEASDKIRLKNTFGKVKIYEVSLKLPIKDFVFLGESLPRVGPVYRFSNYDQAYADLGIYTSDPDASRWRQNTDRYYPFRSLFTGRSPNELEFEIKETSTAFIFKRKVESQFKDYNLILPILSGKELVWINPQDLSEKRYFIPEVFFDGQILEAIVPKVNGYFSANVGQGQMTSLASNNSWHRTFGLPNLPHEYGYLISIKNNWQQGRGPLFWLENWTNQKADLEILLPPSSETSYLIQPPMQPYGLGYSLHFEDISVGRQVSVNKLQEVAIHPIPYYFLAGITLSPLNPQEQASKFFAPASVSHPNPSLYQIKLGEIPQNSTLVLSQSYHDGWRAYLLDAKRYPLSAILAPLLGKEIKDHVMVNNWENGWNLDPPVSGSGLIVLLFWPQYLQYLGFGILGFTALGLIFACSKSFLKACKLSRLRM